MDIVYIILWGLLAVYCYAMAHKVTPILYLAGVFFTFMFSWYLADYLLTDISLMDGTYGIIFRAVALVFLAIILGIYLLQRRTKSE